MIGYEMQTNACVDMPSSKDYMWVDFEDLQGIVSPRPDDEFIVQNQKGTPACTRYGLWHIINGYNILEWKKYADTYQQIDPQDPRQRYCKERGTQSGGSSLQSAMDQAKKEGYIAGYVKLADGDKTLEQMKQAIAKGYCIYTGSSNGDWSKTNKSKIYTLRTDGKFVGHAWNIIDMDITNKLFKCTNSYGPDRGDKGYFWLPFDNVGDIYSKYVIIDNDDNGYFLKKKNVVKARDLLMTLKDFYTFSPEDTQRVIAQLGQRLRLDFPDLQTIK